MRCRTAGDAEWHVTQPHAHCRAGVHRVEAVIAGKAVWFECDEWELSPAPEALAGMFLIPALEKGRRLRIEGGLDSVWFSNVEQVLAVIAPWWNYSPELPFAGATRRPLEQVSDGRQADSRVRGLCFTGGVDSFACLLADPAAVDFLVFVHGFDIPLSDTGRMRAKLGSLRQVAAALEKRLLVIRTNLREHPLFKAVSWERTHGAALAGVGHLLGSRLRRLTIAASWPHPERHPWGSHWEIDHLWSTSGTCIVPEVTPLIRWQKIEAIGGHDLVRRHLHVCWENKAEQGNCSACEKCLRTMAALDACGHLAASEVFNIGQPVDRLIDGYSRLAPRKVWMWERLVNRPLREEVKQAIERLLVRSRSRQVNGLKGFIARAKRVIFRAS